MSNTNAELAIKTTYFVSMKYYKNGYYKIIT